MPELTDEFDAPRLDDAKWLDHYPKWDGRKPGYFSRQNVAVSDGRLHITARREDLPGLPEGYHTFTTGAVRSTRAVKYGYFEIKCRPMRARASSGFWFNEGSPGWWTEIDVFEVGPVGGQRERTVFTSLHVFRAPGLTKGFAKPGKWEAPFNLADDFHTYGLLWEKDAITWYVDGVEFRKMENTHWHNPSHLNLNSEIKQSWFGLPEEGELPATFAIEYVRAWRRAGPVSGSVGAAPPVPSSDKERINLHDTAAVRARRPLLIAHRGGVVSPRIPEGSLAAIREAARFGYDLVELDVRATKDGVPMIFHDANLLGATGHDGPLGGLTESETRAVRFKRNSEPIPSLGQALDLCRQLHLGVMLDLKDPPRVELLRTIAALVRQHGLEKSTLTITGHPLVRAELGAVALVPVSADELKQVSTGEPIALGGRHWFGIPAWIALETIPKLQRAGALVFPAINLFRYPDDPERAQARRDVQALTALGVDGFQIDSAYQDFFDRPPL